MQYVDVILYYLWKKSKQQSHSKYRYATTNCFFKTYINNANVVPENEYKIIGPIKGLGIPGGLPWHLTNEVYVPTNCNGEFHWVLEVVLLKERCIKKLCSDIQKLSTLLPKYLESSGFFYQKDLTNWSVLESYQVKNKSHPFEVTHVNGIAQQPSNNCGLFVVAYAEFLRDVLQVPSYGIIFETLHMRYASLLWNYEILKARSGYVSNNEDHGGLDLKKKSSMKMLWLPPLIRLMVMYTIVNYLFVDKL
ncbi:hypothetical protein R3W88_000817 [Solanum pinnatisectum]|uniref:Ubiquitin-like protease family profile domain-containing protein n=1 Tax=Solanum pinnatisectum TaxID=50273 RepID=A0AAV9MJR9_9SOLN|nr:hypothetical protein R3W88_000817 [Solanum pinnatisectum]